MVKVTLYLPEDLKSELAETARREGRPEAAIVRSAIRRRIEGSRPPRPRAPLFSSGELNLAEPVDELLAGFGE